MANTTNKSKRKSPVIVDPERALYLYLVFGLSYRHIEYLLLDKAGRGAHVHDLIARPQKGGFGVASRFKGRFLGMASSGIKELLREFKKGRPSCTPASARRIRQHNNQLLARREKTYLQTVAILEKYRNRIVVYTKADMPEGVLRKTISSEMKMFINKVFEPIRKNGYLRHCQAWLANDGKFCNCLPLETAHVNGKASHLFDEAARRHERQPSPLCTGARMWDLYDVFSEFLELHKPSSDKKLGPKAGPMVSRTLPYQDAVMFLCNKHHKQFDDRLLEALQYELRTYPR